jgi:CRP/FNR family transcriptional regulator
MDHDTKRTHDALDYLPRKPLTEYAKGSVIYSGKSESLYVVASGRVKISRVAADGWRSIIRIVPPEGLFGECCLINADGGERATPLDRVEVMAWSRAEVEYQIGKNPQLGLALLEEFALAILNMNNRLRAMATLRAPERVMLSLLQLQHTLGKPQVDGAMRMASLTQMVIAEHAGTTRPIVSAEMNRLRRLGMIRYSRRFIDVDCEAMEQALHNGDRYNGPVNFEGDKSAQPTPRSDAMNT